MDKLDNPAQPNVPESYSYKKLAAISEAYNLPNLRFVNKPASGTMTENAILEDENGKLYFAKLYKTTDKDKFQSTYHAAKLVAENINIPVTLPYNTNDQTFLLTIGDNQLALFDYIPHNESMPVDEKEETQLVASMARNLGLIHKASIPEGDVILKPIERWQPNQNEKRAQTLHKIISIIKSKSELDDFDTRALEVATKKLDLIMGLPEANREYRRLSICHGDFHAQNNLYGDDMEIKAICDWDNAGTSHPYIDFLNTFIMAIIGRRFETYQSDRMDIATVFITEYVKATGSEIDPAEMKIAYQAFMSERICTTWPMNQHYLQGNYANDARLKAIAEKTASLSTHYDNIWKFIQTAIQAAKSKPV
jgi:Ser/Thr protein kinase RdoA (MazF antagonist)